jgi:hypothetical protein
MGQHVEMQCKVVGDPQNDEEHGDTKQGIRFAKGLREDWNAVVNGLTHPASNGQTEG